MEQIDTINKMNKIIEKYFQENPSSVRIYAKALMPHFIGAGIFDEGMKGYTSMRKIFHYLYNSKQLELIPTLDAVVRSVIINWFFVRK